MSDSTVQTIRPTDGELLAQFSRQGDPVAFRLLVERHSRLVWAVCRRVLQQQQDIEDAYQATFLVLAVQAKSIRSQHSLAGWLFTVAHRTAVRAAVERHQRQEQELDHEPAAQRQTLVEIHERDRFEALAAELNRLPERLRAPLILFYLEGESRQATAEQLDVTEAAIKSRLARGRSLLRSRLMRRGVSLSIAVGSMAGASSVSQAAAVNVLLEQTVSSAVELATTGKVLSGSTSCVSLSQGIQPMATMTMSKTLAAAGLLLTASLLTAVGLGANPLAANSASEPGQSGNAVLPDVTEEIGSQAKEPTAVALQEEERRSIADFGAEEAGSSDASGVTDEADPADDAGAEVGTGPFKLVAATRRTSIDLKSRRPAEQKILAELDNQTEIEFVDLALEDGIEFLSDLHEIQIIVDVNALEDAGVGTDELITLAVEKVSLTSALNLMLQPMGLTYLIEDEVLKITTEVVELSKQELRVYPAGPLVRSGMELETLKRLIEKLDEEASVEVVGDNLVITQAQSQHRRTVDLLEQLHRTDEVKP